MYGDIDLAFGVVPDFISKNDTHFGVEVGGSIGHRHFHFSASAVAEIEVAAMAAASVVSFLIGEVSSVLFVIVISETVQG